MPKFMVYAKEVVYYMNSVEADNEDQVKEMLKDGDFVFDGSDITDGENFEILEIEEITHGQA